MKLKHLLLTAMLISTAFAGQSLAATVTSSTQCGIFKDVPASSPNCEAIKYVYTRRIFSGYNATNYTDGSADFKPGQAIIRAEVLKVVLAAFVNQDFTNKGLTGDSFKFSDLKGWGNQWWFAYLQEALKRQMVSGYKDGTFKPQSNVTRAEFLKLLLAASPYADTVDKVTINNYDGLWADTPPTAWYAKYVIFANQKGLFSNFTFCPSGNICPDKDATRAEVAQMIYNYHLNLRTDLGFLKR